MQQIARSVLEATEQSSVLLIMDGQSSHTKNHIMLKKATTNHTQIITKHSSISQKIKSLDIAFMNPYAEQYRRTGWQRMNSSKPPFANRKKKRLQCNRDFAVANALAKSDSRNNFFERQYGMKLTVSSIIIKSRRSNGQTIEGAKHQRNNLLFINCFKTLTNVYQSFSEHYKCIGSHIGRQCNRTNIGT